jgi:chromosome segregation ATPase
MNKDRLNSELQALERKIRLLLNQHQQLQKAHEALKRENQDLKVTLAEKDRLIGDFQNRIKISTIVDHILVGEKETREVKKQIDEFIKEIDRCIDQLTR